MLRAQSWISWKELYLDLNVNSLWTLCTQKKILDRQIFWSTPKNLPWTQTQKFQIGELTLWTQIRIYNPN